MITSDFLTEVLRIKRAQLARWGSRLNLGHSQRQAQIARDVAKPHALAAVLGRKERVNIIAEIKRASPSQGVIRAEIDPEEIAVAYSRAGAAAISVLTDEHFFHGSLDDLHRFRGAVSIPILRKDFIIDPYQVYETAIAGADALLLSAALLTDELLASLRRITEEELGMDAMIEVQSLTEMRRAHAVGATLVGVNNRNLSTFEMSIETSIALASKAPAGMVLVSKGGLSTGKHLRALQALGFKGFMIGEFLLRSDRPDRTLEKLIQDAQS